MRRRYLICVYKRTPILRILTLQYRWHQPRRFLQQEFSECLCDARKTLVFPVDHMPVAHDGKVLHIQDFEPLRFQLQLSGVQRHDAEPHSRLHRLFDCLAGIRFHATVKGNMMCRKKTLHRSTGTGARLAHQERFLLQPFNGNPANLA